MNFTQTPIADARQSGAWMTYHQAARYWGVSYGVASVRIRVRAMQVFRDGPFALVERQGVERWRDRHGDVRQPLT
jgi:hypothetical protein